MERSRREFLLGTAWMGAAAVAAGCMSKGTSLGAESGAPMHGFRCAPLKRVRVGVIGVGARGTSAVKRLVQIPGIDLTAVCDVNPKRLDIVRGWLKEHGHPAVREWGKSKEDWKGLADWDGVDVVYSCAPRALHAPINVYSMAAGKHVMQEVPGVFDLDECWMTVEAAEKYRRHCYMLENCCYGEYEMLAWNLINKGKLGEILQAEVGYTHDQRSLQFEPKDGSFWRLERHRTHHGNYYPTHGLVPAGRALNINRGDRFDYLVAMETKSASFEEYGRAKYPADDWRHNLKLKKGDVTTCMIRTVNGKVLQLTHNVCSPTPYDRGNKYLGTRGSCRGIKDENFQVCFEDAYGDKKAEKWFAPEETQKIREEYRHPFWKVAGDIAKKVGGHGGMDFIMDLRWAYCLQNGLPMDTDVYDLATYSAVVELSERSIDANSRPMDFPDFTRGGWKTAAPFQVDEFDLSKFDFSKGVKKDESALNA